jgi:CUG-BP- and ETR3-like factor
MYNDPSSPSTPRQTLPHMPGQFGGGAPMRPAGPYGGQFYPVSSPGPPIQTSDSNKGPDGANLFIFHIPNHFTNLDMYHLFCPYGNLLSVRIMVERETGRSRGFGFVSYDNPESAAMAIKELNGFAVRLGGIYISCFLFVSLKLTQSLV